MTINVAISKAAFDQPWDPISSQGMMRYARETEAMFNDMLNGERAFTRQVFTLSTQKTISAGAISAPTLAIHTVASESGLTDDLDTITAVNNTFVILKAASGHTITIRPGVGNIYGASNAVLILTGNRVARLWCLGGAWAVVGVKRRADNLTATSDPGSGEDAADGYAVGSVWVNTALDRTWLCVDSTPGVAVWRWISSPVNERLTRAANDGVVPVGQNAALGGTFANANDNNNTWTSFTPTTSGIGDFCELYDSTAGGRYAYNPIYEAYYKAGGDLTSVRYWIGLGSVIGGPNADTFSSGTFTGFRYSSNAGDSGWRPVMYDGSAQTTGTAIGTISADGVYKFLIRIDVVNARAFFSVNDSAEQVLSTNYPSGSNDLYMSMRLYLLAASPRSIRFGSHKVSW